MTEETLTLESSLLDMSRREWLNAVDQIVEEDGYVEKLGPRHHAILMEKGNTLLISFESLQGIQALSDFGQPLGWEMTRAQGWSSLCLASNGDTWFRDRSVFGFFDRLSDDGFFDDFEQVIFYGAGPCGYAAAAFSVAAPGAKVLVIQPQATLDPRVTEWDDRFSDMRILDFTTRYGYAPDMLDAAEHAYVVYDPREKLDAMHAALFTKPNVTKYRMRFMGNALQTDLLEMGTWAPLLLAVGEDKLSDQVFAELYRKRRDYRPYLRSMLTTLEAEKRLPLVRLLCANVSGRMRAPRFNTRLRELQKAEDEVHEDG